MKRLQGKKHLCLAVLSRKKCWAQTTWRKKKSPANPHGYWTFWRRVRDSNPRFLLGTQHFECCTFDHSDNSPYVKPEILKKYGGQNNRAEQQNIRFFELRKPAETLDFEVDKTNSLLDHFECCTFDHSDNSPCVKPEILKNTKARKTG